ncbi:unnamed protein product, partial [Symbiodinium sp. KB8]
RSGLSSAAALNIWDVERPVGLDGKPIELGTTLAEATHQSEARMNAHLHAWQAHNHAELDKQSQRLRKEYDELRMANKQRQKEMTSVADELSRIERVMAADAARRSAAHKELQEIEQQEVARQDAHAAYEESLRGQDMYLFMIERLKNEKTDVDLELRAMKRQTAQLKRSLKEGGLHKQGSRNEAARAEALVEQLRARLEHARGARQRKLDEVDATMSAQAAQRAAFDGAALQAATGGLRRRDLDEAQEERMKELFLVRKVYGNMLLRKLREDQRRSDKLESAFQRIRAATGLSDVRAIVDKFLHRADTQASLNASATAARERIEALRREQKALVWRLDEVETEGGLDTEDRTLFTRVEDLNRQVADSKRKCSDAKARFHKASITLEECRAATAKLLHKLVAADHKAEVLESGADPEGGVVETLQSQAGAGGEVPLPVSPEESAASLQRAAANGGLGVSGSLASLVPANRLDLALNQIESRMSKLLAHLAGVVELEEQAATKRAVAGGEEEVKDGESASGVTPASLYSSLFRSSRGGLSAATLTSGRRVAGSAHTTTHGGSGGGVWASGVPLPPNTDTENVRVQPQDGDTTAAMTATAGRTSDRAALQRIGAGMSAPADDVWGDDEEDEETGGVAGVIGGVSSSTVVDRTSLKRLSSLLADRKRGARLQQLAATTAGTAVPSDSAPDSRP